MAVPLLKGIAYSRGSRLNRNVRQTRMKSDNILTMQMDCLNGDSHSTLSDFKYPLLTQHLLSNFGTPTHSEFGNPIQEDIPDIRTNQYMVEQGVPVYRRLGAPQTEP